MPSNGTMNPSDSRYSPWRFRSPLYTLVGTPHEPPHRVSSTGLNIFHNMPSLLPRKIARADSVIKTPAQRPSPHDHRVGIFNQIYEATSRFTFVTACCFANWELTTLCHQNAAPLNYRGERITPRTGLQPVRHSAVTANGQVLRFAFLPFQTGLTVIAGSRAISQNTGIVLYFPIFHAQRTILQLAVDHPVLVW